MLETAAGDAITWRQRAILDGVLDTLPRAGARRLKIAGRPAAMDRLEESGAPEIQERAARITDAVEWSAAPAAGPRPLTVGEQALFARGRELYAEQCYACHQTDGKGMAGLAPPLRGSEWVLGPEERLVRIALHGVLGPIEVAGETYEMAPMPGHAQLPDRDIAALLTYVRRAWDHEVEPVAPATVARIRAAEAGHGSWTAESLKGVPAPGQK